MQFERNSINCPNIITSQPMVHNHSSNINALKYNLFQQNLSDNLTKSSSASEDDNSPTELNNCRRLLEKPPLVKRLTMGILRTHEDSRPLMHNKSASLTSSDSIHTISDGYVNEGICDSEKLITSRFGDSCKQAFNQHQNFHLIQMTTANNGIPLMPMKFSSSKSSSPNNTITTSVDVHVDEKSTNCYNNAIVSYNETNFNDFDFKKNFTTPVTIKGKVIPPILPLRNDALSPVEQTELKGAPWFQAGLPREISLEILTRQNPGAFLVRQSTSKMGCFALSLRVPPPAPKVAHYLILRTQRGFKIKGFTKEFTSLRALITHHSVMKELLPIPLSLPRPHDIPPRHDLDDLDNLWFIK